MQFIQTSDQLPHPLARDCGKARSELRTHYRCGDYLPAEQQLADRYE